MPENKNRLLTVLGWCCLLVGVTLYVVPLIYNQLGHHSGLVAFAIIFVGITLLKYRKDQINK
ncbi:hypothetical protein [Aliikangiella sp. IMCC44359]|uniref:hypothetical protein n=1 Tax=Aliikangiella sp. IMCC44359 TaxID=3459125 RepID=UPI00403AE3CB